jgi:rhodanese-related sulfurtransferase
MKPRVILSIVFLALGFIIAAVPKNKTMQFKVTASDMLSDLNGRSQFIGPDEIADMLVNKDPILQLIDLRSPEEYQEFHLPGAVNIPLSQILEPDFRGYIDQDLRLSVFYANGSVKANDAWIICKQLGYKNNYVLEGGLNYWAETIMNPDRPSDTQSNDEIALYNFRMGASGALGGGASSDVESTISAPLPVVAKRPAKKKVQGGC